MKIKTALIVLSLAGLLSGAACGTFGGGATTMNKIFADMENGIRDGDEELFKRHWLEQGYTEDLVGEGLSGERFYSQGNRKKWFPNPDYNRRETVGGVAIVPAKLYAWEKDREVDEIWFAIADGKVLGGGENPEKVRALAERFNAGKEIKP